jgi:hypothetical protein
MLVTVAIGDLLGSVIAWQWSRSIMVSFTLASLVYEGIPTISYVGRQLVSTMGDRVAYLVILELR